MIYYCADDYALNDISSQRILECIKLGVLNKVSVFPNLDKFNLNDILEIKDVRISLHLNLVEGKCLSNPKDIKLLVNQNGEFKHSFGGLFFNYLFRRKMFERQLYNEIKAQVLFFKDILPEGVDFCIDSHQHTHMIPSVFENIVKVVNDEKICVKYIRIPTEPIYPYIMTPSLYFTYSPINFIKQSLLNFLWITNKKYIKNTNISYGYFLGILFSGKMDEKRINKVLPHYIKLSNKKKKDVEVLFHPGFVDESEADFKNKNIKFEKFYFSENRKTEFQSVMNLSERSVY